MTNNTGSGIKSLEDSKLTFTSGNINVNNFAIYAENAEVNINGENANITVETTNANAQAIYLYEDTKFSMSAGNVLIKYGTEPANGAITGIYIAGSQGASARISGGKVIATSTMNTADAIVNAGGSDIVISGTAEITGSRSGIATVTSNTYGDVIVEGGVITGGEYGILNNATSAKVVLGKEGGAVVITTPIIVGEKLAIFNTKANNKLEIYDGILYSHGANIIYESMNNTDLSISASNTDLIYTELGRAEIVTEPKYSIATEDARVYNGVEYKAAYLKENKAPVLTELKDIVVENGETGTFEIIATGGQPDNYNYEWQVSTDGGRTWSTLKVGTGLGTNKYTTPTVSMSMDDFRYRCIVTNGKTKVTSNAAKLTVVDGSAIGDLRPVVRIVFTDGRVITHSGDDKFVKLSIITKSFAELQSLKVNGQEIFGLDAYDFTNGLMNVTKDSNSPIEIVKTLNGKDEVVEYTYTYNLRVNRNDIITVEAVDVNGRENKATQTVDLFYNLVVDYYKSNLTATNNNLTLTFYANKPVKPVSSITNSYMNGTYLDLISVDGKEYSYRYTLDLDNALQETEFIFEDEFRNEASVVVEEILRVHYSNVKFSEGTSAIEDLNVIDAYKMAQELESVVEANRNNELQTRYGLNSVQSDMFMSRARDVGAVDILSKATSAKSYDGALPKEIEATLAEESMHDYVESSSRTYIAAVAKDKSENELTKVNAKYVDVIEKDISMYKGINITGFAIDDTAPYVYTVNNSATNITATTVVEATFRATIVAK